MSRSRLEDALSACAGRGHTSHPDGHRRCDHPVRRRARAVHTAWPGVHADARREEYCDGGQTDPEHVACAIADHATRYREGRQPLPQVAFVFSRAGTPDLAADPMPPNAADTYVIMKPRDEWPDPGMPKDDLIRQLEAEASKFPGNKFEFSQPIQMRFNELIAGVREDMAVKVFGDEFAPMLRAANQIAAILRGIDGAADVKVEEAQGCRFWRSRSTRRRSRAAA